MVAAAGGQVAQGPFPQILLSLFIPLHYITPTTTRNGKKRQRRGAGRAVARRARSRTSNDRGYGTMPASTSAATCAVRASSTWRGAQPQSRVAREQSKFGLSALPGARSVGTGAPGRSEASSAQTSWKYRLPAAIK
jgi:hypothetical protein